MSGTILVVDDIAANRNLLGATLEPKGYEVLLAPNGAAALKVAARARPTLILMDVNMPEMDGYEACRQLKGMPGLADIPVIFITANDDPESLVKGFQAGGVDYVTKPFKSEEVLMRVETHVKIHNLTRALEGSNGELAARNSELQSEKKRSDDLLRIILPHEVAEELKATSGVKPRRFENVGVLFCDIVGFTSYCDRHAPEEIIDHLQALVEAFECIAGAHGLEKIKTIGDSFMAAAGLAGPVPNPALHCVGCGLAMIAKARELAPHWELRVGVQVGPVIAGVVGRRKYQYDVWGDAVNTAARLENAATAGSVCVTTSAWRQVADHCEGTHQGSAQIKGKGELDLYRIDRLRVPSATA